MMVTDYHFRTLAWVWLRFRDLPAELGRQDGTPEVTPKGCRGRWEWCLPASSLLLLPRLGERATAVGLHSRGSPDSWLRWSFTFSLMQEFLPFHRMCNRVLRHACQSQGWALGLFTSMVRRCAHMVFSRAECTQLR